MGRRSGKVAEVQLWEVRVKICSEVELYIKSRFSESLMEITWKLLSGLRRSVLGSS